MSIHIANPIEGQATHTSRNRADYLVSTGQADWAGGELVILDSDKRKKQRSVTICNGIVVVDRWTFPHTQWLTAEVEA
jgi:hypothetical protein